MDNQQPSSKKEWKTVIEYDHYEVNQFGEIRHKKRQHILKPRKNKGGYLYVNFNINGHRSNFAVHRIVANAFIPNPNHKPEVNHKDGNKENNCVNNLEWVNSSENKIYFINNTKEPLKQSKGVEQWTKDGELLKTFNSVSEAAKEMNCVVSAISNCCLGRSKTSMGYVWKFVEGSTTKYERNPSSSVRDSEKSDEDIV